MCLLKDGWLALHIQQLASSVVEYVFLLVKTVQTACSVIFTCICGVLSADCTN